MEEKIKQFVKKNWISFVIILVLIVVICSQGCDSTWRITGNTVNVNNKCKNDSIENHNDSINHEVREIPEERVDQIR